MLNFRLLGWSNSRVNWHTCFSLSTDPIFLYNSTTMWSICPIIKLCELARFHILLYRVGGSRAYSQNSTGFSIPYFLSNTPDTPPHWYCSKQLLHPMMLRVTDTCKSHLDLASFPGIPMFFNIEKYGNEASLDLCKSYQKINVNCIKHICESNNLLVDHRRYNSMIKPSVNNW